MSRIERADAALAAELHGLHRDLGRLGVCVERVLAVFAAPMAGLLAQKTDPRRLIFIGLVWLAGIMMIRAGRRRT